MKTANWMGLIGLLSPWEVNIGMGILQSEFE